MGRDKTALTDEDIKELTLTIKVIPPPIITMEDALMYSRFSCGCLVTDNRKRLYKLTERCGRHKLNELVKHT